MALIDIGEKNRDLEFQEVMFWHKQYLNMLTEMQAEMLSRNKYLKSERQNYVRLGELILVLLTHVNDGGGVASLELL